MLLERKLKKIQKKRPSIPCFWKDTCMEIEAVENIFQKKSKKSEPFGAFLERYLFGAILADYRLPERKIEKRLKKKAPLTAFLERYLFGEIGNKFRCREGIIGKMEKNQKQRRNFQSFWKDTCSGRSGQITGFPKEKSKKV